MFCILGPGPEIIFKWLPHDIVRFILFYFYFLLGTGDTNLLFIYFYFFSCYYGYQSPISLRYTI